MTDITNQKLFGLVSSELAVTIVFALIGASMAYQAIASDVIELKKDAVETRTQAKELITDVQRLKVVIERVETNQKSNQKTSEENLRRVERGVEQIRAILDKAYK